MDKARRSGYSSFLLFLASSHFMIHVLTEVPLAILPTLRAELGISLFQASLLISIPFFAQVFAYIPAGIISERRVATMIAASFLVTALAAMIIPYSSTFNMLLIGFSLLQLGSTLYHPPGLKVASEIETSKLTLAMVFQQVGGTLGIATGPIVVGFVLSLWGWRASFLLWIGPLLVATAASYLFVRKSTKGFEEGQRQPIGRVRGLMTHEFLLVLVAGAIVEAAFINLGAYMTTFFTEVKGISQSLASIIFGFGILAGIGGSFLGGAAGNRLGKYKASIAVILALCLIIGAIPLAPGVIAVSAAYVVYRSCVSAFLPLMNVLITSHSAPGSRSIAFSVYFLVVNVAIAFAPSATSLLVEAYGITTIFFLSILMLVPSIFLILRIKASKE